MHHRLSLPLLVLLIGLATGCATPPSANQSPPTAAPPTATQPETEVVIIEPWTAGGLASGFSVVAEASGSCFAGALTAARADAWRCSVERAEEEAPDGSLLPAYSQLLDPCLENPYDPAGPLACLGLDGAVTLLTLTEPLPREYANTADLGTLPIAITLDNGDECALATGATLTVDVAGEQQRINYFCGSGGVLIGRPDTSDVIWTIYYSTDPYGLSDIKIIGISRAYAFRGDTGNVGWSAPTGTAAPLREVRPETLPGLARLVFDFGDGPLPAYEVGYVNEPPVDEAGRPFERITGDYWLRIWFAYPDRAGVLNEFKYDHLRVDDSSNFLGVGLSRAPQGSLMWLAGLMQVSGFTVTRDEAAAEVIVDIFEPLPSQGDRPLIGVGSRGPAVRLLRQRLSAAGYLTGDTTSDTCDQDLLQAIAGFQAAHGQIPNGVAGPAVWAALERPLPPPRNGTSAKRAAYAKRALAQGDALQASPSDIYEVYVRGGPGLDYPVLGSLLPGQPLAVVGQLEGSSADTSWWEVCCIAEQRGWVRADVVNVSGAANVPDSAAPDALSPTGIRPNQRPLQTAGGNPILYFTFDDGPWATYTEAIAAVLAENGGRGTFFTIGRQVDWTPTIAAALVPANSVQNHTYNHNTLDGIGRTAFFSEAEQTQAAIQRATGQMPTCLRPPYGATDDTTRQMAAELGLDVVLWTVDTQDWMRPGVEAIVNEILTNARPGAIILMHDGGGERDQTLEALRIALPQLRAQGYVFQALCG